MNAGELKSATKRWSRNGETELFRFISLIYALSSNDISFRCASPSTIDVLSYFILEKRASLKSYPIMASLSLYRPQRSRNDASLWRGYRWLSSFNLFWITRQEGSRCVQLRYALSCTHQVGLALANQLLQWTIEELREFGGRDRLGHHIIAKILQRYAELLWRKLICFTSFYAHDTSKDTEKITWHIETIIVLLHICASIYQLTYNPLKVIPNTLKCISEESRVKRVQLTKIWPNELK